MADAQPTFRDEEERRPRGRIDSVRGPQRGVDRLGRERHTAVRNGESGSWPVALDEVSIPELVTDWYLAEDGYLLAREHEIESLFAVSNGHIGIRGSLAEGSELSDPGVFVAGLFAIPEESEAVPEMLMLDPGWLHLRTVVNGYTLDFHTGKTLYHRRVLDLRRGLLWREWRHEDPDGRITHLRFLRLASLADRCLVVQSVVLTPENYSGRIKLMTSVSGTPSSSPREWPRPSRPVELTNRPPVFGPDDERWHKAMLSLEVPGTSDTAVIASASRLRANGGVFEPVLSDGRHGRTERWEVDVEIGSRCRLDRLISIQSNRTSPRPRRRTAEHLHSVVVRPLEEVIGEHIDAWDERWSAADVEIDGDPDAQEAIRFACYHLIAAANPEDERSSIGARALTGRAYKGHVFWDTEIYMIPFYVLTQPSAARALLMYRYRTLPSARRKAAELGYRGALYAWESTQTGSEATPSMVLTPDGEVIVIRNAEQENHISADIAYAVWQYWVATGDDGFLRDAGAEIVLETARFWASRARPGEDGQYRIESVIGPDEYHEDVTDNAYTNGMARWNLERGVELAELLHSRWPGAWDRVSRAVGLDEDEVDGWREIAQRIYTGFDEERLLFEQFRGYFELEDIDLAAYEPRSVPMDVLLGRERTQQSQVVKQPDVLMLLYLLWDEYPAPVHEANFDYYEPRCGHGSSLSPSIHALYAARLGRLELALQHFRQAAEIDLANNMGNAAGGVHAAALGGLWQAIVFGFAGLRLGPRGLAFDPRLPEVWDAVRFAVQWHGRRLSIEIDRTAGLFGVRHLGGGGPVKVSLLGGDETEIGPGECWTTVRSSNGWQGWQREET